MKILDNFIYFKRLIEGRILRKNIPLTISLSLTGNCNFRCSYCYCNFADNKKRSDLSTNWWFNLIDESAEMGTKSILLLGGEPLLRNDIEDIVDKIKEKHIICSMNSNGSLIRKKINAIKRLDYIIISLDGVGETNDKNRGEGTYDLIMEGIRNLQENKIPFSLVCVITRNNISQLDTIIKKTREIGSAIEFNLPYEQSKESEQSRSIFQLSNQEIKYALRLLNEYKCRGFPIILSNKSRKYALAWPLSYSQKILYDEVPIGFRYIPCYMGKFMCHIEYDGMVYPCAQLIGHFQALDFCKVGLKKAWENTGDMKKCKTCYSICLNEFNLLYNLDFTVLFNTVIRKL